MIYKKHSTFNYIKKLSFILLRHGCRGKTILLYIIFLTRIVIILMIFYKTKFKVSVI